MWQRRRLNRSTQVEIDALEAPPHLPWVSSNENIQPESVRIDIRISHHFVKRRQMMVRFSNTESANSMNQHILLLC